MQISPSQALKRLSPEIQEFRAGEKTVFGVPENILPDSALERVFGFRELSVPSPSENPEIWNFCLAFLK